MKKPDYVYVTYIETSAEKVWQALTQTDLAREYWLDPIGGMARVNVSDWKVGSLWKHQRADATGTVDIVGRVVEVDPPHRLVITWARPAEFEDEAKHSRVSFDIEAYGSKLVRLTVAHDDLARDSAMLSSVAGGWPKVFSNLKTFLESGRALPREATTP